MDDVLCEPAVARILSEHLPPGERAASPFAFATPRLSESFYLPAPCGIFLYQSKRTVRRRQVFCGIEHQHGRSTEQTLFLRPVTVQVLSRY